MFFNILKHTLKNIVRNKFLTFSSILIIGLLIFFINILIILHDVSHTIIKNINNHISIDLYLKEDIDDRVKGYRDFKKSIEKISSHIEIDYLPGKRILENFRKNKSNMDEKIVKIIKGVNSPFPNTVLISNIEIEDYEKINKLIKPRINGNDAIFDVDLKDIDNSYKEKYSQIKEIALTFKILIYALYFFIFIFVVSIFIIIYSIIGNFIFHYRNEIYITKLIGGSKRFIYGPFTLQGIIYAILAFFISIIGLYYLLNYLPNLFKIFNVPFNHDMTVFYPTFEKILPIELAVFIFIGALSGLLSSKKYSKEIKN